MAENLDEFLINLDRIWKDEVQKDYRRYHIAYEYDIYTSFYFHLRRYISVEHILWRINTNYANRRDLIISQLRPNIQGDFNDQPFDRNFDEYFERNIAYFEIKLAGHSHESKSIDLEKFIEFAEIDDNLYFIYCFIDTRQTELENDNVETIRLIDSLPENRYFELRGYHNPHPHNQWGLYNSVGDLVL